MFPAVSRMADYFTTGEIMKKLALVVWLLGGVFVFAQQKDAPKP